MGCASARVRLVASHRQHCYGRHYAYLRLVANRIPLYGPHAIRLHVWPD